MPQVTHTLRAEADLDEIWFYIAVDNVAAADNLLDDVDKSCQLLAMQPDVGRLRSELAPELRSFPVGRYVLFTAPKMMESRWSGFCTAHGISNRYLTTVDLMRTELLAPLLSQ